MKVDVSEIFRNYDQKKAEEHIENLQNDIRSKEESIKTFLKEKSSQVIDNTIKIKSVYASVDKIKCQLEDIICSYNDFISGVRNTASVNFGEPSVEIEKLGESEKGIIKEVWKRKCESYDFLFQSCHLGRSTGEGKEDAPCDSAYHIVKMEKEELYNYDCFYLNNYINHVYLEVNKKMSEENYSFVLNKIYTDIFLCLKVLNSLLKNEKIKNIYINMFNSNKSILYLNTYVNKHKENFGDILLKLIYASYHNLAYNYSCKMDRIPQSVIVLLLFYNKQNCERVEIVKNDLFKEILDARINLLHNFLRRQSHIEDEGLPLRKVKSLFLQVTYLVLHTKYMFLLLIDVSNENLRQGVKEDQFKSMEEGCSVEWEDKNAETYDDHTRGNDSEDREKNLFLRRMQMELFILQNIPHQKAKKNKQNFNYAINSMDEIKKIMNEGIIDKFSLLHKTYVQFSRRIYDYMIHLLHVYYCKNDYGITCDQLFTEYENINKLYNKLKGKIEMKEKYYSKYIKDVDFYLNNNYLHAIHDEIFEIFIFLFFNKFLCAVPFFDQNPVDKWKLVTTKFLHNLFWNISISYERNCQIKNCVFYSFLLNTFYYYYEFFSIDLDSIYDQFYKVDRDSSEDQHTKKNDQKKATERVYTGSNASREGHFHNGFKTILKEKINPLIYSAYKLIVFVETKEINHSADANFLLAEQGVHDAVDFFKMFNSFMSILKSHNGEEPHVNDNVNAHTHVKEERTASDSCGCDTKKENGNCSLNRCSNLVSFLNMPLGEEPTHVANTPKGKFSNGTATMPDNNVECETVNLNQEEQSDMLKGKGPRYSENMRQCGDQNEETEKSEEEYKELSLYINLLRHNDKRAWNHFLSTREGNDEEALSNDYEEEAKFSFDDLRSIFLRIAYKILKTSLKCFCVEYLDNLEDHLHFYLNMLINNDIKNIVCEKMNGHLVNIFSFSNLFMLYVERLFNTDVYRSIIIFLVKNALQKEIYKIYAQFISEVEKVYTSHYAYSDEKNKTLLNKKVTELYNIILLDLSFCVYILDTNNIIHKSTYDDLMSRYRKYETYYIKSCLYFVHIYKEKYNVYSEKSMNEYNAGRHPFWEKLNEKDAGKKRKKKNAEMYTFKYLIDNILTVLNKLDNLNGIIFQKHIRLLAQNLICDSYLLYYLFVEGPPINNLLGNVQTDTKTSSLEIFHFNKVRTIDDNSIEDKLLKFFF
ncbi:conserved Plasmodium protein, unknown function [Plasmodium knowlesi strain H]|uniref:Uncharacterized protein n=3 Tax=Plasmodium knowlesi TaxID=5850 RepID=A0A1A7VNJ4_PLAKH|nr:conserved Plasmodium protein, unknown function [Plasmodium knowlesi strain H]OTN65519.1 Uncharacterized protein PKNOH_S110090500 [Plasmodium knowlesi]CAA9989524.1 conserved Plasmodium protein, unknown function [Plasmodium knowlesi strain H]SBO22515.1 conserved Plasmodium protein, unknown function [Plasmodium knowlesi strain H]SBO23634.1 conserved Plasmodium protein, unknown function [Plasmodium knowlesi strain H]VVS78998.1 conserved Plasmodium protein, unknown function [Plasmodium knowlesi 